DPDPVAAAGDEHGKVPEPAVRDGRRQMVAHGWGFSFGSQKRLITGWAPWGRETQTGSRRRHEVEGALSETSRGDLAVALLDLDPDRPHPAVHSRTHRGPAPHERVEHDAARWRDDGDEPFEQADGLGARMVHGLLAAGTQDVPCALVVHGRDALRGVADQLMLGTEPVAETDAALVPDDHALDPVVAGLQGTDEIRPLAPVDERQQRPAIREQWADTGGDGT